MEDKRSSAVPVLAAIILLLVPLASYVAAYFLRSAVVVNSLFAGPNDFKVRAFPSEWEATLFTPAAAVEALVMGRDVTVTTVEDWIRYGHSTGGSSIGTTATTSCIVPLTLSTSPTHVYMIARPSARFTQRSLRPWSST
jgi:hypothetical protein